MESGGQQVSQLLSTADTDTGQQQFSQNLLVSVNDIPHHNNHFDRSTSLSQSRQLIVVLLQLKRMSTIVVSLRGDQLDRSQVHQIQT